MSYRELDGGLHTDRWEWVPAVLMLSVGVAGSGAGWSIFCSQRVNCAHKVWRCSTAHPRGFNLLKNKKINNETRYYLHARRKKRAALCIVILVVFFILKKGTRRIFTHQSELTLQKRRDSACKTVVQYRPAFDVGGRKKKRGGVRCYTSLHHQ